MCLLCSSTRVVIVPCAGLQLQEAKPQLAEELLRGLYFTRQRPDGGSYGSKLRAGFVVGDEVQVGLFLVIHHLRP